MEKLGYFNKDSANDDIIAIAETLTGYRISEHEDLKIIAIEGSPFSVLDPGAKKIGNLLSKFGRAKNKLNKDNSKDGLEEADSNELNLISDYARCAILLPNFEEAIPLIETILSKFGGIVKIRDKYAYKAFHINFMLPYGENEEFVKCEIQFHTYETYKVKLLTDEFYQEYRDQEAKDSKVPDKDKVLNKDPKYLRNKEIISELCDSVYKDSGFEFTAQEVKEIEKEYTEVPVTDLTAPVLTITYAHYIQPKLVEMVEYIVKSYVREKERQQSTEPDPRHVKEPEYAPTGMGVLV